MLVLMPFNINKTKIVTSTHKQICDENNESKQIQNDKTPVYVPILTVMLEY